MTKQESLAELQAELDTVLAQMQAEDIDVEQALALHDKGQKLADRIETRLQAIKLQVDHQKQAL